MIARRQSAPTLVRGISRLLTSRPQPVRPGRRYPSGLQLPVVLANPVPVSYQEPEDSLASLLATPATLPASGSSAPKPGSLWFAGYVVGEAWDARLCGHPDIRY